MDISPGTAERSTYVWLSQDTRALKFIMLPNLTH